MRLLPRTKLGTWLLAVGVWAGCCTVAWKLVPVRPRAVWPLPDRFAAPQLLPDGTAVLFVRTADVEDRPASLGLLLWDLSSGSVLELSDAPDAWRGTVSPDGRWAAIVAETGHEVAVHNILERSVARLPISERANGGHFAKFVAPGVLSVQSVWGAGADSHLHVWRLPDPKPVFLPRPDMDLVGASADGSLLALGRAVKEADESEYEYVIWDADRGEQVATFRKPRWCGLHFVLGSTAVVATCPDGDTWSGVWGWRFDGTDAWCVASVAAGSHGLACGNRLVAVAPVTHPTDAATVLELRETLEGRVVNRLPLSAGDQVVAVNPDGRTAVVDCYEEASSGLLARVLTAVGLDSLVPRSNGRWLSFRDMATGTEAGRVSLPTYRQGEALKVTMAGGGEVVAVYDLAARQLSLWDIPPQKPLSWAIATWAGIALPAVWWAWWRCRRLKRAT